MNRKKKIISNIIYYSIGIIILTCLINNIGLRNIIEAIWQCKIEYVIFAMLLTVLSSVLRIFKLKILMPRYTGSEVADIFISSRAGKELTFLGYFIPLLKKDFRSYDTAGILIADRFFEIVTTVFLGLVCSLLIFKPEYINIIIVSSLSFALLLLFIIRKFDTGFIFNRFKRTKKIYSIINGLQQKLKMTGEMASIIYLLTLISTILDFYTALIIFKAVNISLNFLIIPVVWASSGLVSIITFMIIGTTEFSVIYLYEKLGNIPQAATASFVFLSRIVNLLTVVVLSLVHILIKNKHVFSKLWNIKE